jgi:tripeptide aminopeptidase
VSVDQLEPRLDVLERGYLSGTFGELCRIEGGSGRERRCADRVIAELRALDIRVGELSRPPLADSDCASLLARIPAAPEARGPSEAPSVLLCAHLDTAPLPSPPRPVLVEGCWEGEKGVLGAGNKAAVAVLLALARRLRGAGPPVDVELLFTVCREAGLAGARAIDASRLRSRFGYVFDHAAPLGALVAASPAHFRLDVSFRGTAGAGGPRRTRGGAAIRAAARAIAAMDLGRLDGETTAEVRTVSGGGALDAGERDCSLVAEVRGVSPQRAEAVVGGLIDHVYEAANMPECECDVDVAVQRTLAGYRLPAGSPALCAGESALRACGHAPIRVSGDRPSDADALIDHGLEVVNLGNGIEPPGVAEAAAGERVGMAALASLLELTLALLGECSAALPRRR